MWHRDRLLALGSAAVLTSCQLAFPVSVGQMGQTEVDAGAETGADARADPDARVDGGAGAEVDAGCVIMRGQPARANTMNSTTDAISVTMTAAQTAGDSVVIGVNYVACGAGVTAITDTKGNDYKRLIGADTNDVAGTLETWAASNIAAAAPTANKVTVTFAETCSHMNTKVVEYSSVGTISVDAVASAHGTGGAPTTTLETHSGGLLFAHTADSRVALGPGIDWMLIFEDEWGTLAEDQVTLSAGAYDATFQPTSGEEWVIQAVALSCK